MTSDTLLRGIVVILVLLAVLIVISYYFNRTKKQQAEKFDYAAVESYDAMPPQAREAISPSMPMPSPMPPQPQQIPAPAGASAVDDWNPADLGGGDIYSGIDFPVNTPPTSNTGCFPKDSVTAEDLLPKDAANSTWSQAMPAGQGDVSNKNFLTAGYHVGLSSSVIRNANYGLRSEPAIPKRVVSPWGNSTIDPDLLRKPLEVESGNQCE